MGVRSSHPGGVPASPTVLFDVETHTATCRRCWISEDDVATAQEAKAWRAIHRRTCTVPQPPAGTVLAFPQQPAGA